MKKEDLERCVVSPTCHNSAFINIRSNIDLENILISPDNASGKIIDHNGRVLYEHPTVFPETSRWKNALDRFNANIFEEMFLDLRFYLGQLIHHEELIREAGADSFKHMTEQIPDVLDAFEANLGASTIFQALLHEKFNSDDPETVQTAAFIYLSMGLENPESEYLNTFFRQFPLQKKAVQQHYIFPLRYGLHPGINRQLQSLCGKGGELTAICREILEFRTTQQSTCIVTHPNGPI